MKQLTTHWMEGPTARAMRLSGLAPQPATGVLVKFGKVLDAESARARYAVAMSNLDRMPATRRAEIRAGIIAAKGSRSLSNLDRKVAEELGVSPSRFTLARAKENRKAMYLFAPKVRRVA